MLFLLQHCVLEFENVPQCGRRMCKREVATQAKVERAKYGLLRPFFQVFALKCNFKAFLAKKDPLYYIMIELYLVKNGNVGVF